MTNEEKPWILYFGTRADPIQIDEEEYEALMGDLKEQKPGATLKDGSYINLRIASIVKNEHYISPESIKQTRRKKAFWNEFQHLKNEGVVETMDEYKTWKKKKNEKKRTT